MTQPKPFATRRIALAVFTSALAVPVLAQDGAPQPLWELGAVGFGVSQQAYPGSDEQVNRALLLPYLIYRGPLLRADRDGVGLRAYKTERLELDVGFAGAFGSNAEDIDARRGMPDLGTLVEFGPRLKWDLGAGPANGRLRAEFALRGVYDLSDSFKYKGLSFEPRLIYERSAGGWRYGTNVGLVVGNQRLTDTFYGVATPFATPDRPAYSAQSGLIAWRVGANASRELTPNIRLFGFARYDSVAGGANKSSPLVRTNGGATVGLGLVYTWARSRTMTSD